MTKVVPLRNFAELRNEWLEALSGDDRNSVASQLLEMMYFATVFRVVNESRRIASKDSHGNVRQNAMLHELIDRGFVDSQFSAIRRLKDRGSDKADRGVYSLIRILNEMRAHQSQFTRSNMLCAEGLAYELAELTHGSVAFHLCKARHEDIDALVHVDQAPRCREDVVPMTFFNDIETDIESACAKIEAYVNKFIAHAATPGSRQAVKILNDPIRYEDLSEAHRVLCVSAATLSKTLLGGSFPTPLAVATFDRFEFIDRPLIEAENVDRLRTVWKASEGQMREWVSNGTTMELDSGEKPMSKEEFRAALAVALNSLPPEAFADPE